MSFKTLILIVIVFLITISCSHIPGNKKLLVSDSYIQMGTQWQIKIYAADTTDAKIKIQEAWQLLDTINALLSNYTAISEISQLGINSGSGEWLHVHPFTIEILDLSRQVWEASHGAFDITIGPVTKVWRRSFDKQELPNIESLEAVKQYIGGQYIELDKELQRARLSKPNMSIDLGGIGKGYAIDKIADHLMNRGIRTFLIDGGGDIRLGDGPPQSSGWVIAKEQLNASGELEMGTDTLYNCSVASSGNRYQYIDTDTVRYQHHINPRTGYATSDVYQVTVFSDACWKADALSTAISILGSNEIRGFDFHGSMITGNNPYEIIEFDVSKE